VTSSQIRLQWTGSTYGLPDEALLTRNQPH
jgi:hypothetical protein